MAIEGEASFSEAAAATSSYPTGGAGGKLTRQPARRHAATPYSRPPQNQIQRRPWISRIVDPAYRIISGGATRILPYFFSKATSPPALTAPDDQHQHQDKLQNDDTQENVPSTTTNLNKLESASFEEGGPSGTANVNDGNFSISAQIRGETALNDAVAISELERLMEGKSFSQAETDRLIEIISSRAIDLPDVKRDERTLEISLREGAKKNMSFLDKRKEPIGGKDANSELWTTPTPLPKSIIFDKDKQIHDEAGLSPAELAKAYMGGQTSLSSSQGFVARNEKDCFDTGMLVGKSSLASPSSKPSACWPGIKSTEQSGFATPQRESFGLQNFPRTPYSRTILSNSKSKLMQLQNDSSKRLSNLQSPSQSVQTRYGQLSKGRDGGLFGPSRRSRQSTTPSIVSPYSRPSRGSSRFENSDIIKSSETGESDYLSRSQTTTYGKHKESEVGTPTVPPHSSQIARTILDKIGRSQSNPRGKSAELKLATSWRYPESSKTVEQSSSNANNVKKDGSAKLNEDVRNIFSHNQSSFVLKPPANSTADTQNGMTKTAPASNGIFPGTQAAGSSGTAVQYELGKPKSSLSRSTHGEKIDVTSSQDAAKAVPYSFGGEPANLPKPPSHSLGNNKPVLPSISIAKPFQKWAVPSGTNAGFTFPVSSSDGATSSEPTTPSIMPFTTSPVPSGGIAITSHHRATKDDEIPQYSFNSKRAEKSPLVFDFPSVSEEVINEEDDASLGIEFTFGSEKTERIPFGSAGSDGVCC
ncbi:PREDICTED: nuclear pore complex protein NUP1 isoform X1 [Camelina sativa]|uniref:Nuclear pore complex protein NUP1 isoform X1 n=1 Tax=Camelina sativa TaxID=90675 RepID=A0ABM0XZ94_CAMSA|nr:PREDICTED: nuclear pore complex protein NUP1 isoform X1 [Camelina sativa]